MVDPNKLDEIDTDLIGLELARNGSIFIPNRALTEDEIRRVYEAFKRETS